MISKVNTKFSHEQITEMLAKSTSPEVIALCADWIRWESEFALLQDTYMTHMELGK